MIRYDQIDFHHAGHFLSAITIHLTCEIFIADRKLQNDAFDWSNVKDDLIVDVVRCQMNEYK